MIFEKTEAEINVLNDRSVELTTIQRTAFILFDGRRSVEKVLAATSGMGVTLEDVERLVALGLLAKAKSVVAPVSAPVAASRVPANSGVAEDLKTPGERYQEAYSLATQLVSGLGLRGFRLSMAIESASGLEDLKSLAPKIADAVGAGAYAPLKKTLFG